MGLGLKQEAFTATYFRKYIYLNKRKVMKEATNAPMYATLYPGLCQIARENGYTLAIHGSLQQDLDLIAVPWTDDYCHYVTLAELFLEHLQACLGESFDDCNPERKLHGRIAYNLYMDNGAKVDLSIMMPVLE